jgi:hypothetical protein
MKIYKQDLLKHTVSILLLSGMLMVATGVMVSHVKAAPMAVCTVGTPCTTGGGVTVGGGALSATTDATIVNNGTALTATGQDQLIPFKFLTTINDARGTGVGWNVSASATAVNFTTATSDLFLATTAPVTASCAGNSTCSSPGALSLTTGGADLVGTSTVLASAAIGAGLGAYNLTTLGNFVLPGSATSGAATGGVVSITVSAGP